MAIYRADRDARHRGGDVAVAVRRSIPHRSEALSRFTRLEAATIVVKVTEGEVALVSTPPLSPNIEDDFDSILPSFSHGHGGWPERKVRGMGGNTTNSNGNLLISFLLSHSTVTLIPPYTPTRFPSDHHLRPEILDVALKSGNIQATTPKPIPFFLSDQILITFAVGNIRTFCGPRQWVPQPTNWDEFRNTQHYNNKHKPHKQWIHHNILTLPYTHSQNT